MQASAPLCELRGVSKVFRTADIETHALSEIDLQVHRGEFVAISGPSGSGKTTMLSVLGLLDPPSDGEYRIEGESTRTSSVHQRARLRNRHIGFVFQAFNLIGGLTVEENVALPLAYRGVGRAERKSMVHEALQRVDMVARAGHRPNQLSGGQQQGVAVARAVVGRPSLLLADEPTGNLDSSTGTAVMDLLAELHRDGTTVCMVTHDPRYVSYAGRVIEMFDGRVVGNTEAQA